MRRNPCRNSFIGRVQREPVFSGGIGRFCPGIRRLCKGVASIQIPAREYISTFPTGFSQLIPQALKRLLPGARVLQVYDGLVHYRYSGRERDLGKVFLFHNTFFVIRSFAGSTCELDRMIRVAASLKSLPESHGTFRVRYSVKNQFVAVPKDKTRQLEGKIAAMTHSRIDRVSPETEYWFLQRSEGVGFFCRLLGKRQATEKDLHPGELRPELAYLMASLAKLNRDSVVLDPFAGYGGIAKQVMQYFPHALLDLSDLDPERAQDLKKHFGQQKTLRVSCQDALKLKSVPSSVVDAIITDPPWGYYEDMGDIPTFYHRMFRAFRRVLKARGRVVLLSARKQETETAAVEEGFILERRFDTLVNGKKAAVYVFSPFMQEKS